VTFFNLGGIVNRVLNRGSQNPLEVEILGYDLADAQAAGREVARVMREVPNVADVQVNREGNYPQFSVVVDREKAATVGLTQRDIAQAALFSLNSNVSVNPSIFTDPRTGNQYNIVVQLDEPFRVRPEDLGKIFVTAPGGRPVVLSTIAEITRSVAPVEIERKYQQRLVRVSANPVGRDLGAISDDIEKRLATIQLPPGFEVRMGGQTAQQREAFSSLTFMTILSLMLVYMVMASQFRSLKDPFIIMFSVPMGLIGVILALFLTRTTLSTTSFMGIIMMVGIVVSNGVLLVEYTNELRRRGLPLADAVLTAGRTRLRPILMTSLTTVVGLLPMAVGFLVGSEANAPLARAVIGGLVVSTGLTLLLIPTLYTILEERFPRTLATEDAPVS
jgi:multidrug efflux pump subunit AcrB